MTMVEADINRPRNSAPASPMKILAGWKLNGRKPEADPAGDHRHQRADVVGREHARVHEPQAVDGEGPRADGHDPGGQAVEAVDQVDRVGEGDHPQGGDEGHTLGLSTMKPARGTLNWYMVTPRKYRMLAASTSPATLAGADMSRTSSIRPDGEDGRRGQHHPEGLGGAGEDRWRAGRGGHDHGHQEAEEHGRPARRRGWRGCGPCGGRAGPRSPT